MVLIASVSLNYFCYNGKLHMADEYQSSQASGYNKQEDEDYQARYALAIGEAGKVAKAEIARSPFDALEKKKRRK